MRTLHFLHFNLVMTTAAAELPASVRTQRVRSAVSARRTQPLTMPGAVPATGASVIVLPTSLTDAETALEKCNDSLRVTKPVVTPAQAVCLQHRPVTPGYPAATQTLHTTGGKGASSCRPRNDSRRLQMRPLPINIIPVISQNTLWS